MPGLLKTPRRRTLQSAVPVSNATKVDSLLDRSFDDVMQSQSQSQPPARASSAAPTSAPPPSPAPWRPTRTESTIQAIASASSAKQESRQDTRSAAEVARERLVELKAALATATTVSGISLERVLRMCDTNHSGTVDFSEFTHALRAVGADAPVDVMREMFTALDLSGDGE